MKVVPENGTYVQFSLDLDKDDLSLSLFDGNRDEETMIHFVTVVGSRLDLLPHTLKHYRDMGITSLLVNVHLDGYKSTFYEHAAAICEPFGAKIVNVFAGRWLQEVNPFLYRQTQRQYLDDWFVLADVDEFQVYPRRLDDFLESMEKQGYDYVQGFVIDRIAKDGRFPPVRSDVPLWEQYPLAGLVTPRILNANCFKIVAAKGYVRLTSGQHRATNGIGCPIEQEYIPVHHFKWSNDVLARLRERVEVFKAYDEQVWPESQRFIDYYCEHQGRIDVQDPDLLLAETTIEYHNWPKVRGMALRKIQQMKRRGRL